MSNTRLYSESTSQVSANSSQRPTNKAQLNLDECTGMDVFSLLHKKRQNVTGLEIHLNGLRAPDPARRYTEIKFVVGGRGISEKIVARSTELSQEKYCFVSASVHAKITSKFQIIVVAED